MNELLDLQELAKELVEEYQTLYTGDEIELPIEFKNKVSQIDNNPIVYQQYSAIVSTRGGQRGALNIYLPNQWFYIASFFTRYYTELQKYKSLSLQVLSSDRLNKLKGNSLTLDEENKFAQKYGEHTKDLLKRFVTDYDWWGGGKTIDRGDFFVSPILNYAKLVNVSQSYVADLCAFLARNENLVELLYNAINQHNSHPSSIPKNTFSFTLNIPLQQIFYGAPGTGKSHTINEITELQPKENVFRTTFHPDSDYSTFVGCYKPTKENATTQNQQSILDYDTLVDKFKEYLGVKDPYQNITRACTLFGYDFHDSIVRMQESNTHTIPELVADAYKSGTTYDSQVRAGMACYEESVKPQISSSKITYSFVPQTFTKAYLRAWQTEEPVYLVIEEINRGNCAQIFGDLFQLLDRKNGVSEYPIKADNDLAIYIGEELAKKSRENIPENVKSGEELVLPSNLYIWATMNTSDQSLFPIDSAFKRRWDWTYIPIDTTKESWNINADGVNYDWSDFLEKINAKIESATSSEDKMLGFYFCKAENDVITAERFVNKVVFYLWNDVFKDYGFDDAVFNDENNKKITFRMFYKADGKVDESMVKRFLENLGVKNDKTPKSEIQE